MGARLSILKGSILALLSGLFLALCFPYADLGFIAFFALVPLLIALYGSTYPRAALYGLMTGWVLFAAVSYWVAIYGVFPFVLIVSLAASVVALFSIVASYVMKRTSPLVQLLILPSLWVAFEFLRSELGSFSYPYGVLGYTQTGSLPVLQTASLIGVYGVSFLIVLVNVGIAILVGHSERSEESRSGSRYSSWIPRLSLGMTELTVVLLIVFALVFGYARLSSYKDTPSESITIGVVQPSIEQKLKWDPERASGIMTRYEKLVDRFRKDGVDLIVFPEATLPLYVEADDPLVHELKSWADKAGKPLLAGVPLIDSDSSSRNTAQLIYPGGDVKGRYDKIYPVPFGEFVPLRPISERLWTDFTVRGDVRGGDEPTVFEFKPVGSNKKVPFGVVVCSESMYSHLARRLVSDGAEALFVMTNDAWFYSTNESDLHFDMSVARAVENGVYIAQAANSGVSGVVSPTGRVTKRTGVFEVATFKSSIGFENGRTFFTRAGYLFPYIVTISCFLFLVFLIFSARFADKRSEDEERARGGLRDDGEEVHQTGHHPHHQAEGEEGQAREGDDRSPV